MYRVERYAIEPLPKDSVVDGNINNLDAVSDALKRCHKRLGSSIKNLALALPRGGHHQEDPRARRPDARKTSSSRSRPRPTSTFRSRSTR